MAREVLQVLQQLSINFQTSLLRAEEREEAQSGIHGGAAELSAILVRLRCFRSHGAVLVICEPSVPKQNTAATSEPAETPPSMNGESLHCSKASNEVPGWCHLKSG